MNENHNNTTPNNSPPKIIDSKEKEISEQKPPNDKIVYFNLVEENDNESYEKGEE
ncbi:MAG: hypothetical protein ACFFEN_05355 [Candidatus Thorarchaeota archaeon]